MSARFYLATAFSIAATSATAEIVVDQAMITNGELRVRGRLNPARATEVMLDDKTKIVTDDAGRFLFRLAYYPPSCTVR
jgi:hypothetical protein